MSEPYFETEKEEDMEKLLRWLEIAEKRDIRTVAKDLSVEPSGNLGELILTTQDGNGGVEMVPARGDEVIGDFCDRLEIPRPFYYFLSRASDTPTIKRSDVFSRGIELAKWGTPRRSVVIKTIRLPEWNNGDFEIKEGTDEIARGFVSDRHRHIPDEEVLKHCVPTYAKLMFARISRAHSRFAFSVMEAEPAGKGSVTQVGFRIRNSDTGDESFGIDPYVRIVVCKNGASAERILRDVQMTQKHLRNGLSSQEMLDAIADNIDAVVEVLPQVIGEMEAAAETSIDDIEREFRAILGRNKLSEKKHLGPVLAAWRKSPRKDMWGVANAITRYARDQPTETMRESLEELGGRLMMVHAPLAQA